MAPAFERDEPQEVAERIIDVSSGRRRAAARDPIEPLQAHHVIDAQDPGVPHVGAQRGDDRGKAAPAQGERVDRREPPILPGPEEKHLRCLQSHPGNSILT